MNQYVNDDVMGQTGAWHTQAELAAAFDTSFQLWHHTCDGAWRRCSSERQGDPHADGTCDAVQTGELSAWLESLAFESASATQVGLLPSGKLAVAVPVSGVDTNDRPAILMGAIPADPMKLARLLAQTAAQRASQANASAGQQELMEQYASRLSGCFEELTFLRRLSRHVEHCVANRSLGDAAKSILPQLRTLVDLESLGIVAADTSCTDSLQTAGILCWSGTLPGGASFLEQFIHQQGNLAKRTIVKNFFGTIQCGTSPEGVRSIVLVPIAKDGVLFGWIVGCNKVPPAVTQSDLLGQDEIGSMEASLLDSAATMLAAHAVNHKMFQEREDLIVSVIHTLVGVIEAKDAYTCGHSDRVALIASRLAAEMGLNPSECQDVLLAGLLHDIGKIGVPDDALLKPTRLTPEEFELIKRHPEIGARLLAGLRPLQKLVPGVLHHHESLDGTGYPHGLAGEQIPLIARILAVADSLDAMTSDRPYRSGMSMEKAEEILLAGAGKQWDPKVVDAYFAAKHDIGEVRLHWKHHLQLLLSASSASSGERTAVGAAAVAASAFGADLVCT